MKIEYRKKRTRIRPLMRQQICFEGERNFLAKITKNNLYYEPLMIYNPETETEIYYDFSSLEQDPKSAAMFFNENYTTFFEIVREFYKELGDLLFFLHKRDKNDFKIIYKILCSFWAKISLFVALGDLARDISKKEIKKISYKLRVENDKIIYETMNLLTEIASQLIPKEFIDQLDFLLIEEIMKRLFP